MSVYLPFVTAIPMVAVILTTLALLIGQRPERWVFWVVSIVLSIQFVLLSAMGVSVFSSPLHWVMEPWFQRESHPFIFELYLDKQSWLLFWVSNFISSVVGYFSFRYLHRDAGFFRFFTLYLLFVSAVSLSYTAGNLDVLLIGWEVVGLTSVLLIGFFQFRDSPPRSSYYALVSYRICDVALTAGVLLAHVHHLEIAFVQLPEFSAFNANIWISTLLIVGCLGKTAQLPFSMWLPRAMEGPTPSSAVFYGAVSAHMGAYLLWRLSPIWRVTPSLAGAVTLIGFFTSIYGAFVGRTRPDAKSQLAYAAMAQLGLIFAEIGLDWDRLAVIHMVGHSFIRTLQFLKAPSLLHEFHKMAATGKRLSRKNLILSDRFFPARWEAALFNASLRELDLPRAAKAAAHRILALSRRMNDWEGGSRC